MLLFLLVVGPVVDRNVRETGANPWAEATRKAKRRDRAFMVVVEFEAAALLWSFFGTLQCKARYPIA